MSVISLIYPWIVVDITLLLDLFRLALSRIFWAYWLYLRTTPASFRTWSN